VNEAAQTSTPAGLPASADGEGKVRTRKRTAFAAVGLVLILAVALGLRLRLFVGFLGSDDVGCWYMAHGISRGVWRPERFLFNPLVAVRYGFTAPAALFLGIFGSSEATVMIYPILMSLVGILAAWDCARRLTGSIWGAHFAALVVALASLDIHYSAVFLPDLPMVALSLLALWCVIVASQTSQQRRRGGGLLLFCSGLLVALAVAHKIVALQVAGGLGLWGLSMIITRRFRWRLMLILAGFLAGSAAEHALFWGLYDDPSYRWKTIQTGSAQYRALMETKLVELPTVAQKMRTWGAKFRKRLPSFSLLLGATCILGLYYFIRSWRDTRIRLICFYIFALLIMRLAEFTRTFSYQPRRLLPFAGCGAILLAVALSRCRRVRLASLAGVAFLAAQAYLLATVDARTIRAEAVKHAPERWIANWARENAGLVGDKGLYVDHRTYRMIYAWWGFQDPGELGIYSFTVRRQDLLPPSSLASPDRAPERPLSDEGEPEQLPRGAFFFENCRVLNWLLPTNYAKPPFRFLRALPETWALQAIVENPRSQSWNAALHQIDGDHSTAARGAKPRRITLGFDGPHRPDGRLYHGWFRSGAAVIKRVHEELGGARLGVELAKGKRLTLVSGSADLTQAPKKAFLCGKGAYLAVRAPIRVDRKTLGARWAEVRLYVVAYDEHGERHRLLSAKHRLYYPRQELRGYIFTDSDVYGLRVAVRFQDRGRYELEPFEIDCYDKLPYDGRY